METGRSYVSRKNYRFLEVDQTPRAADSGAFELDESDMFGDPCEKQESRRMYGIRTSRKTAGSTSAASSLPVSVPDWSKILKDEYRETRRRYDEAEVEYEYNDDDDVASGGARVPPHEYIAEKMARARIGVASFSVHEGAGRTLKGRDLSRVRNAIWAQTGFED